VRERLPWWKEGQGAGAGNGSEGGHITIAAIVI